MSSRYSELSGIVLVKLGRAYGSFCASYSFAEKSEVRGVLEVEVVDEKPVGLTIMFLGSLSRPLCVLAGLITCWRLGFV